MLSNPTKIKNKLEITTMGLVDARFILLFSVLTSSHQDGDAVHIVWNLYGLISSRSFLYWMSAEEICHVDLTQ